MEKKYTKEFLISKIFEYVEELGIKPYTEEELNLKSYNEILEIADDLLDISMK